MNKPVDKSHEYYTEKQTYDMCRHYIHKYECDDLRAHLRDWFDGQLDIAAYLGIHWHDLYRKDTDLKALFEKAARGGAEAARRSHKPQAGVQFPSPL